MADDRVDAIVQFVRDARFTPAGDLALAPFDQDQVDALAPWQVELIKVILEAPADHPFVLIPYGPSRVNWRNRFR